MLFDPESVDFLEDRAKVDRVHGAFVRILGHYLQSEERFGQGMRMLGRIRCVLVRPKFADFYLTLLNSI